jgi:DNA repair protein RecO
LSYTIHTTSGFIVDSRPSGEAGKLLSVFTKDLGLIRASAQGIRFEKSKLRPFVQNYSFGKYSFVKGKEYWRLTNADEVQDTKTYEVIGESLKKKELIARVSLLLSRLLQGEETHPELFTAFELFIKFINKSELSNEELTTVESLIVIRILHRLGYVGVIPDLVLEITSDTFDVERLKKLESWRIIMNQHINKALRESHL